MKNLLLILFGAILLFSCSKDNELKIPLESNSIEVRNGSRIDSISLHMHSFAKEFSKLIFKNQSLNNSIQNEFFLMKENYGYYEQEIFLGFPNNNSGSLYNTLITNGGVLYDSYEVLVSDVPEMLSTETQIFSTFLGDNVIIITGGPSQNGDSDGTIEVRSGECSRDQIEGRESFLRFKTKDDYDGRFKGHGEWYFIFLLADDVQVQYVNGAPVVTGPAFSSLRTGKVTGVDDNDEWVTPWGDSGFYLHRWDLDDDGDKYKVHVYEHDGGRTKTINLTANAGYKKDGVDIGLSATIPIDIDKRDDQLGEFFIYYCEETPFQAPNIVKAKLEFNEIDI